jgi:thioredoxin 1
MSSIRHVTDEDFASVVLEADRPVLVDFWAPWCGPCLQVAPVLEQLADELAGRVTFVKLNVDENPVTASTYRVIGLPTLNVYEDGQVVRSIRGARPRSALLRELEGVLQTPSSPSSRRS